MLNSKKEVLLKCSEKWAQWKESNLMEFCVKRTKHTKMRKHKIKIYRINFKRYKVRLVERISRVIKMDKLKNKKKNKSKSKKRKENDIKKCGKELKSNKSASKNCWMRTGKKKES